MMQLACARIKPHHVGIRLRAYLLSALLQSGPERAPRNRVYDENQGDVETIKNSAKNQKMEKPGFLNFKILLWVNRPNVVSSEIPKKSMWKKKTGKKY